MPARALPLDREKWASSILLSSRIVHRAARLIASTRTGGWETARAFAIGTTSHDTPTRHRSWGQSFIIQFLRPKVLTNKHALWPQKLNYERRTLVPQESRG